MPRDRFGMKIYEGNRVMMSFGDKLLCGIVTKIDDPRVDLVSANGAKPQPRHGHMVVLFDFNFAWNQQSGDVFEPLVLSMDQPVGKAAHERPPVPDKVDKPS